ncbi:hypothetical protein N7540_008073 [Penicillium herquei]|nr:hypothetical protein N7540_008073 [Penicillium herquei]
MIEEISSQRTEQVAEEFAQLGSKKPGLQEEDKTDAIRELSGFLDLENATAEPNALDTDLFSDTKSISMDTPLMNHEPQHLEPDLDLDTTGINQLCREALPSFLSLPSS